MTVASVIYASYSGLDPTPEAAAGGHALVVALADHSLTSDDTTLALSPRTRGCCVRARTLGSHP